ncbi:hypothetical protein ACFZAR_43230 [Streptomyces sp. NPDC008222]|uniref:hypothetical protein n=1 Tax=Streptomyces sp. NPDC008222 TaxID=3364820 RepID=UPI0036E23CC2
MTALHEQMAANLLDQMLYSPSAAQILAQTRQDLRANRIPVDYRDRIGQTQYQAAYWSPAQAAAFLRVHTGLMSGEFGMALVEVGEGPAADAEREANAERLARLHPAFSARLDADQSGADADGELRWAEPIHAQRSTGRASSEAGALRPELTSYEVPPGCIPLEGGATFPSRTLLHLHKHGGVARWPYGSTVVALLLNAQVDGGDA